MAMENKPGFKVQSPENLEGEQNDDENQNQNDRQDSRIFPEGGADSGMNLRHNSEGEE